MSSQLYSKDSAGLASPISTHGTADYLAELTKVVGSLDTDVMEVIVDRLIAAYERNRSVYLFGNGGSAALASHMACDLGKGTAVPDRKRLRVISLTDNIALLTAWANDLSYEHVFAEQLRNFLTVGDISFAISCSGNSPNVLKALAVSRDLGGYNIGLSGYAGGKMKELCDVCLVVPSSSMQHIEDTHVITSHAIFMAVRAHMLTARTRAASAG